MPSTWLTLLAVLLLLQSGREDKISTVAFDNYDMLTDRP